MPIRILKNYFLFLETVDEKRVNLDAAAKYIDYNVRSKYENDDNNDNYLREHIDANQFDSIELALYCNRFEEKMRISNVTLDVSQLLVCLIFF